LHLSELFSINGDDCICVLTIQGHRLLHKSKRICDFLLVINCHHSSLSLTVSAIWRFQVQNQPLYFSFRSRTRPRGDPMKVLIKVSLLKFEALCFSVKTSFSCFVTIHSRYDNQTTDRQTTHIMTIAKLCNANCNVPLKRYRMTGHYRCTVETFVCHREKMAA